ncbi:CBS domain-containing protein [Nonomuraea rhodomycinica]|uniref:CBS domain-containing protein n=1 Tax=Nonomuraea rhodomycinica TaxID=1712872 RepID=A0A7Y6M8V5_9ACTN|nr:CBS domain-containing protein [Nonomuraea rhodomycinica]NUW39513.1 CBS domain-containing protein [Nonomuraea rhodomycinica]
MRTTVQDVMTTDVAAVNEKASFHTVADLLIERGVSGVPVVDDDNRVLGVVSETDLLAKEEFKERYYGDAYRPPLRARLRHTAGSEGSGYRKAQGETAGALMTSPARTTTPDASVVLAARRMDRYGVKRLPVVDDGGRLVGIVSRRDLIKVFLRSDGDIERRIRDALPGEPGIAVSEGVVTLSGVLDEHSHAIRAVRLAENVDGVVAVHDELSWKHDDIVEMPMWGGA